jgi:hypothetical protein
MGESQQLDPGSGMNNPDPIKFFDEDPGWRQFWTGIWDGKKVRSESATLTKTKYFFNGLPHKIRLELAWLKYLPPAQWSSQGGYKDHE